MERFKVTVRPNSPRNEIVEFDKENRILKVSVKAQPDKGKANRELVNFLSRELGKKVRIMSGFKSRKKVLEVE